MDFVQTASNVDMFSGSTSTPPSQRKEEHQGMNNKETAEAVIQSLKTTARSSKNLLNYMTAAENQEPSDCESESSRIELNQERINLQASTPLTKMYFIIAFELLA